MEGDLPGVWLLSLRGGGMFSPRSSIVLLPLAMTPRHCIGGTGGQIMR